jgi:DMSO/TMAO reductase YedYZ molybdopterin-dependent catalytic subunit
MTNATSANGRTLAMLACALVSPTTRTTRRRFLQASAGAAAAAWWAAVEDARASSNGERRLGTVPFVGEGAFPLDTTVGAGLGQRRALDLSTLSPETLLTPQDKFFVRTGCPDRLPAPSSWRVRLRGLVDTPVEIPIEQLKREASDRGTHLLECAGNSRAAHFGFISAASWTGVPLEHVLKRAALSPGAKQVLVSGFDEHSTLDPGSMPGASWVFGLDQLRDAGAFLATGMNGAPLGRDHGDPLRLVVPGWYGCTAIKWVNEITLVDDDAPATDHMREYAGRTHQDGVNPPRRARDFRSATIDPAAVPVRVEKLGGPDGRISFRVVGISWGGRAPSRALRIRFNPDMPFVPVEKVGNGTGRGWALWSHRFPPPAPGRYRIELAVREPAARTRRLDAGFYAREIEIA